MPPVRPPPSRPRRSDFLPGTLTIERGTFRDYRALEHFHYAPKRPATWAGIWVARFDETPHFRGLGSCGLGVPPEHSGGAAPLLGSGGTPKPRDKPRDKPQDTSRVIAVGVLSYPFPRCLPRERYLGLPATTRFAQHLPFINAHVRTISRSIVHPQFRGAGVASRLIHRMLDECPTRYVETQAVMARVHPMFDAAGMQRIDPPTGDERRPVYFIFDKEGSRCDSDETK